MPTANLTLAEREEHLTELMDTLPMAIESGDEQALALIHAEIEQAILRSVEKRDATISWVRRKRNDIAWHKAEAEFHALKAERLERTIERLKVYVLRIVMPQVIPQGDGKKRLEGRTGAMYIQRNPNHVVVTNEAAVPDAYKTVVVEMPAPMWRDIEVIMTGGDWANWWSLNSATVKADVKVSKAEIKKDLTAGIEIPGAELRDGDERLEIR